jgi:hypothetical protein
MEAQRSVRLADEQAVEDDGVKVEMGVRPPQLWQIARPLQERGTSRSYAQARHRMRAKPCESSPQRRNFRNSLTTKPGSPLPSVSASTAAMSAARCACTTP